MGELVWKDQCALFLMLSMMFLICYLRSHVLDLLPSQSEFPTYKPCMHLHACVCPNPSKVWKESFWMMHWGSPSPKRTCLWANSYEIRRFNRGRLSRARMAMKTVKTSIKYKDRAGRQRWKGSPELRQTQ